MGCCTSSPHSQRRYRDPADLDEEIVALRYFGTNRVGSNLVPDHIPGMPSAHLGQHLATGRDTLLYEAQIDHGKGFRCYRIEQCLYICPWHYPSYSVLCPCDESCLWTRKEYSTRTFFRIFPNRIEVNNPSIRFPFGCLGCGSWNADKIVAYPFDRGAFGFSDVRCGILDFLCFIWPIYGGVVARHRCQCNGPLYNRMFTDCGGWWCDEWLCKMCFCTFRYGNLAYPDEVAFAASIALQAYFEGRTITRDDVDRCVQFWKDNIALRTNPMGRKRSVCCEPFFVPLPMCIRTYKWAHPDRKIPYKDDVVTDELKEIYERYSKENARQLEEYENFVGPVHYSTLCRACGCRRLFGRQGFCFCTEGCHGGRKAGEPAPPFDEHDFDDEWDASTVLIKVVGPPPPNVVIRRWRWDPEQGRNYLDTYPENAIGRDEVSRAALPAS